MYTVRFLKIFVVIMSVTGVAQAARYALLNESDKPVTISLERARFKGGLFERADDISYQLQPKEGVVSGILQPRAYKVILTEYTGKFDKFGDPIRISQTWEPSGRGLTQFISIRYQGDGAFLKSDKSISRFRSIKLDLKKIPKFTTVEVK